MNDGIFSESFEELRQALPRKEEFDKHAAEHDGFYDEEAGT